MSGPDRSASSSTGWWSIEGDRRALLTAWVHLAVLWSFAVAQPLFDVLADDPAFFVARGNTSADIVIFSIGLVLIPPTVLIAIEALFVKAPRVRIAIHVLFVAGLVATFFLQLFADSFSTTAALFGLAGIAGVLVAIAYARVPPLRSILTVLGPVPLLFLVLFLLTGPVSDLVLPSDEDTAAAAEIKGETPVVMVVFDELSGASLMNDRGRVDGTRYPNFARLAGASTWYRDATTVADVTAQAVPALLSGTRATSRDTLPTAAAHPNNLFTLLGKSYDFDVYESATRLCPEDLCESRDESSTADRLSSLVDDLSLVSAHQLVPEALDRRLPAVDQTFAGFGDDEGGGGSPGVPNQAFVNRAGVFQGFVAGIRAPGSKPTLHFMHTQLPHIPWEYLPSGQQYPVTGPETPGIAEDPSAEWAKDPSMIRGNQHRYLLQLGFVDHLLGELIDRLEKTGQWDRSLVVVTADHGISFEAGKNRRYIDKANFGDIAGVPLFIKAPEQRAGSVDTSPVVSLDIVPTIARYLGVTPSWKVDGRALQSADPQPREELRVFGYDTGWVTEPLDAFRASRDAVARETAALTASSGAAPPLYTLTAAQPVEGRRVSTLPQGAPIDAEATFDSPGLFESVRPAGRVVPSYVSGVLSGSIPKGQTVAIAVNGRIQTVVPTFEDHGDLRFGGIVPPSAFRPGRNSVRVYAVEHSGDEIQLAGIGVGTQAKLVERDGGETLALASGREAKVGSGDVQGAIDRLTYSGNQLDVTGWAVDGERDRGADAILVFADGRLLVEGRPNVRRPDIADQFGERADQSGYELHVYSPDAKELADPSKIRVFAVTGDAAGELKASGGATIGESP